VVLVPQPNHCRVPGWQRVPNGPDKVHRDEARGETFDKVPAAMELLQKVSTMHADTPSLCNVLVCSPTLPKCGEKGKGSVIMYWPPLTREGGR